MTDPDAKPFRLKIDLSQSHWAPSKGLLAPRRSSKAGSGAGDRRKSSSAPAPVPAPAPPGAPVKMIQVKLKSASLEGKGELSRTVVKLSVGKDVQSSEVGYGPDPEWKQTFVFRVQVLWTLVLSAFCIWGWGFETI